MCVSLVLVWGFCFVGGLVGWFGGLFVSVLLVLFCSFAVSWGFSVGLVFLSEGYLKLYFYFFFFFFFFPLNCPE